MRNLQAQSAIRLEDNMNVVITMAALEEFVRDNIKFITHLSDASFIAVNDHDTLKLFTVTYALPQDQCGDCVSSTDEELPDELCSTHVHSEDVWYEYTEIYYYQ